MSDYKLSLKQYWIRFKYRTELQSSYFYMSLCSSRKKSRTIQSHLITKFVVPFNRVHQYLCNPDEDDLSFKNISFQDFGLPIDYISNTKNSLTLRKIAKSYDYE